MLLRLALSICAINTTMQKTLNGNKKKYLAAMLVLMGTTSALATTTASADSTQLNLKQNVHSGDFDLTKQVGSTMDFPVMFDRPSGVNAAALAGTVQALGTDSALYKSALKAVPELSDTNKINSLLSDALDSGSANYNSARNTIVKLINWYNSLGGTRITTQGGQAYTTANLDQPINVLAVAFSNSDSVNQKATTALANVNASRTVGDVARALDAIQSGLSVPYTTAFDAYASKVYAPNANLNDLTQYSAVSGVLNAYEGMYANGASAIRKELLNGEAKSTEAGVTFFESAVLAGNTSTGGGDSTGGNTPTTKTEYHTRWVDESGKDLATPTTSETGYDNSKTINGYHLVSNDVNGDTNTKTYHYEKDKTPEPKKIHTTWVDENGNKLKPDEDGAHPDNDGKSDVPGYDLVKVTTDKDGNVINTYKKHEEPKPEVVTHWVDEQGNKLKDDEKGAHPDTDGKSDVPGYDIVRVTTDENGNVTNVYRKHEEPKPEVVTHWVDEQGNKLKNDEKGAHPDNDGKSDVPGYDLVRVTTDKDGNVTNVYKKHEEPKPEVVTHWVDEQGNKLKDDEKGAHPDNDGKSDIPGYDLVKVTTDKDGNVTNTYKKHEEPKPEVVTHWVDEQGNKLKDDEKGAHPDTDGTSDIEGYDIVRVTTDENGNVTNVYRKHENPTPQPTEKNHTYWVDTEGNTLKPSEEGQYPDNDGKSDIDGYDLVASYTVTDKDIAKGGNFEGTDYKAGDVINIYKKHEEPKADIVTHWVDENGNKLKDDEKGSHPDNDGVSDISGYEVISVKTDNDGNITNVYRKINETHTTWVDENGNKLKPDEDGSHPDNDGVSDIDGYEVIAVKTDKDGNITNVYRKISKIKTSWVDEQGNKLKADEDGSHPDNDGVSDIDGYEVIAVKTDKDGNITNVYRKINKVKTSWVDEQGHELKPDEDGSHPDNDGVSDIDGYALVTVKTDEDGNVTNIYRKLNQVHTSWVDTEGNKLKPDEDGAHPDTDGKSDIDGYKLVSVKKDKDGNIVNTYEKIPAEKPETPAPAPTPEPAKVTPAKQATPKPVATPTATPASQKTLPQTGSNDDLISAAALGASSIVALLGGLTIKKRKHEN